MKLVFLTLKKLTILKKKETPFIRECSYNSKKIRFHFFLNSLKSDVRHVCSEMVYPLDDTFMAKLNTFNFL